ncbi:precorrin-2 dehydrogenase / sirohydrochlorin ferrochelatase [Singulisphaera sp. GP187]|uniref:precorrin-2 dehydrogenase/sirohydrochlorin ferrochelatase family protein n=1 Tax=Singulisphaera sp. GP187 TaxID=1882752 RepID=UPI000928F562|nr:NAD(P)-dependent oxidoreductase [Singulisphaera sp. GP187]SIO39283.1 precorrin-2 dehydrogenase / sirohydrochlorin ferrochelatase [Singulisphaera sp. GP187]
MAGYPIELELRGKRVLVVGLGPVGRRKVAGLIATGARVLVVDPAAGEADRQAGVEIRPECYRADHLQGMVLVFAAAPAAVNRAVVADAQRAGVWVGSASDPREGDFTVPAVWREGPLTLTVSTSGASPALAAALRDRAAEALGPAAAGLVALLAELRPEVLARLGDQAEGRRRVLADWADPRWIELWRAEGPEAVRRALGERLEREASGSASVLGDTQGRAGDGPDTR